MIIIHCAYYWEASCLIKYFKLKKHLQNTPFQWFSSKDIHLIISGEGKVKTAAACSFLASQFPLNRLKFWLNVGIINQTNKNPAEGFLIHKITDQSTHQSFYPTFTFSLPCKTTSLFTCPNLDTPLPQNACYDQEASAFFECASLFSPSELIHSYKIIANNQAKSQSRLSQKNAFSPLIQTHLKTLDMLINKGKTLCKNIENEKELPSIFKIIQEKVRFSLSEKKQLEQTLRDYLALFPDKILSPENLNLCCSKCVLKSLQRAVQNEAMSL